MLSDKESILKQIFMSAMEESVSIIDRNMKKWGHNIPCFAEAGVYNVIGEDEIPNCMSWHIGFGIGIMWLLYNYTGNEDYKKNAEGMLRIFLKKPDHCDQCQGVMYMPSCVPAFKYAGNKEAAKASVKAADMFMAQYSPKGKYFRAFKDYENYVVDSAINTVLLHWASDYTGNPAYYDAAKEHLATEIKYSVRPDGSTYHQYWFDSDGNPTEGTSAQGYKDSTCWSRGQAWAMLGYALHYRFTGNSEYLSVFKKLSAYYFANLNSDMIPSWDLVFVDEDQPRDSAAAAIAVCAVLEMAKQLPDDEEIKAFKEKAISSMLSLIKNYSTVYDDYIDALLLEGIDNYHRCRIGESVIYGDYFYLEALVRLLTDFDTFWQ